MSKIRTLSYVYEKCTQDEHSHHASSVVRQPVPWVTRSAGRGTD
jgi:hypothetical protein